MKIYSILTELKFNLLLKKYKKKKNKKQTIMTFLFIRTMLTLF